MVTLALFSHHFCTVLTTLRFFLPLPERAHFCS
jgi:hypothetical protein